MANAGCQRAYEKTEDNSVEMVTSLGSASVACVITQMERSFYFWALLCSPA